MINKITDFLSVWHSLPAYPPILIPFYLSPFFLFYPKWNMELHLIDEAGWKGGD